MKKLGDAENHGFAGLKRAVAEMVDRIDKALPDLNEPIKMVIAGGVAVNFYCGTRVTLDVDASFSTRIVLPDDLVVPYAGPDGRTLSVHLDRNYNSSFALMHEDFEDDAVEVEGAEFTSRNVKLFLLSPVDLAISKIARLEGPDQEDIAELAKAKLIVSREVAERAREAMTYYVGNTGRLESNLRRALAIIESVKPNLLKQDEDFGNGDH
jgi:hypothetical protein